MIVESRSVQALAETDHDKEDRCNPPPQGTETPSRSRKASNLEDL